ncbi:MAG: lytic transglycosylase domain-containing protein [Clostridia bacterium]|nr:lytic transglycosylase domain-containing protein [Clostridia bacterium]
MKKIEKARRDFQSAGTLFFAVLALIILSTGAAFSTQGKTKDSPESIANNAISESRITTAKFIVVEEPIEECEPDRQYYDIPLSTELQDYIFDITEYYDVPAEVVIAIIQQESSYRPAVEGQAGELGYMQIHPINFERLSETLHITDFTDPKQNIHCGVFLLSELFEKYDTTTEVLMCYNCGERGAKRLWDKGITETTHSKKITTIISGLTVKEA